MGAPADAPGSEMAPDAAKIARVGDTPPADTRAPRTEPALSSEGPIASSAEPASPAGPASPVRARPRRAAAPSEAPAERSRRATVGAAPRPSPAARHDDPANGQDRGTTAPQLRRFIKSRAYVPLHELRRRFALNGGEDDVFPLDLESQRVYVGLPPREGRLLAELVRGGDVGVELSLDPIAPIVVGVFPMRPVPRG